VRQNEPEHSCRLTLCLGHVVTNSERVGNGDACCVHSASRSTIPAEHRHGDTNADDKYCWEAHLREALYRRYRPDNKSDSDRESTERLYPIHAGCGISGLINASSVWVAPTLIEVELFVALLLFQRASRSRLGTRLSPGCSVGELPTGHLCFLRRRVTPSARRWLRGRIGC
jgi:hypothetical protein